MIFEKIDINFSEIFKSTSFLFNGTFNWQSSQRVGAINLGMILIEIGLKYFAYAFSFHWKLVLDISNYL